MRNRWITDLAVAGFGLIPLMPGTKTPYTNDWVDTKADPLLCGDDFADNYGIVLRDDIVVVDVDPRGFKSGENAFFKLLQDVGWDGQPIDTYTVRSRQGMDDSLDGLHLYFKKPKGITLRTKNRKYPGIDIKSYGAMLVGPGSIHPDTLQPYMVLRGQPDNLLPVWPRLLELYERAATRRAGMNGDTSDDSQTKSRFKAYLAMSEPAIQGDNGDNHTFQVACVGRDYGLSENATFELMRDHWNERCAPPWPLRDLAKKVANAYAYAENEAGANHPSADFEPVEPTSGSEAAAMTDELRDKVLQYNHDRKQAEIAARIRWDMAYDNKGNPTGLKNTINNILNFFNIGDHGTFTNHLRELVRLNTFSHQIEFCRSAPWHKEKVSCWRDIDTIKLIERFSHQRQWNPPKEMVYDAVAAYADDHQYHPVRDYLESLEWDGVERIDLLFPHYAGTRDTEYTRAVSKCFMVACIARVMQPGCQHDHVPILEGRQGTGKSTFCRVLGGQYYGSLHLDPRNKDTISNMSGIWIVELSEFTCARKAEANELKAFISTCTDVYRKPYSRSSEKVARQTVFIATINPDTDMGYLKDRTGNRRFWPLTTGNIRLEDLKQDRDQLFAEAMAAYRRGERWHLDGAAVLEQAEIEQNQRVESEIWAEAIETWLIKEAGQKRTYQYLMRDYIATDILNVPARQHDRYLFSRIANAMKDIGWIPCRKGVDSSGSRARAYKNPNYDLTLEDLVNDV